MIYLRRVTRAAIDIAICEAPEKAARYEAKGYYRCSREALSLAWSVRGARTLDAMRAAVSEVETAPLVRAVGHSL